jgi:hypothetical protein
LDGTFADGEGTVRPLQFFHAIAGAHARFHRLKATAKGNSPIAHG